MQEQPIILFDGVCNFCNSTVNFVIKRDQKSVFKFTTLKSSVAQEILESPNLDNADIGSFVLFDNDKTYTKSTAALRVCLRLNGLWPLMYGFIIVPKLIRNAIYNSVAKNRYRWFGKKEVCMVPSPDVRKTCLNESL
jgi:predicted DCC family thiol-disulfide oxidoreductase YuxK